MNGTPKRERQKSRASIQEATLAETATVAEAAVAEAATAAVAEGTVGETSFAETTVGETAVAEAATVAEGTVEKRNRLVLFVLADRTLIGGDLVGAFLEARFRLLRGGRVGLDAAENGAGKDDGPGRLNQTAYGLFLFIRDLAGGDLVAWIDRQLATADDSAAPDRLVRLTEARNRGKFPGRGGSQRLESMIQAWDDNAHS